MDIVRIILPLFIVSGIVLFVIFRLKHKYNKGELGKKTSKNAQLLLNVLIPMGMLTGCMIGIISGIFFPMYALYTVSLGTGAGYLFGYIAYEMYSKKEEGISQDD